MLAHLVWGTREEGHSGKFEESGVVIRVVWVLF